MLTQSFSLDSLRKIQALEPSLPLILLYKEKVEYSEISEKTSPIRKPMQWHSTAKDDVDRSLVSEAYARSLEVPYTVNEEQEME